MQSALSFSCTFFCHPRAGGAPETPTAPSLGAGTHPLQLLPSQGLQFAIGTFYNWQRMEKWPQSITTSVTVSQTVWSRTSRPSSILCPGDSWYLCYLHSCISAKLFLLKADEEQPDVPLSAVCYRLLLFLFNQVIFRKQLVEIAGCRGP